MPTDIGIGEQVESVIDYEAARVAPPPGFPALPEIPGGRYIRDDFHALAFEAYLLGLRGDAAGSEALYRRAQDAYADSSPVGLAWLYVQQGAALLEAGDPARARPFFEAARQRLPAYTLATEHLAETEALLGNDDRAGDLYREAIAASDDPARRVRRKRDPGPRFPWERVVASLPLRRLPV